MANLYASIRGQAKTEGTRRGNSEISGHVRGWDLGVEVRGFYDKETKKTRFEIYQTGGSKGVSSKKLLVEVKE